jgi:hypothetical protein
MVVTRQVTNMEHEYEELNIAHHREGFCPTCGNPTEFIFLGVQRWPARLVELTGCPPVTVLYTCSACQSTISEADIE